MLSANRAGWQFTAVPLSNPSTAWGGDGNHRLDYPCRLAGICIDRPKVGFSGRGSLWIDDVALLCAHKPVESAALTVEVQPKRFGNVYPVGEPVSLRAYGQGRFIRWSFRDFWGTSLARGQGEPAGTEISFTPERTGYFAGTIELCGSPARPLERQSSPLRPCRARSRRDRISSACARTSARAVIRWSAWSCCAATAWTNSAMKSAGAASRLEKANSRCAEHGAVYLKHAADLKMRPLSDLRLRQSSTTTTADFPIRPRPWWALPPTRSNSCGRRKAS